MVSQIGQIDAPQSIMILSPNRVPSQIMKKRECRRMKISAALHFCPKLHSAVDNSHEIVRKSAQQIQPRSVFRRFLRKIFGFLCYALLSCERCVFSRPFSRFIHSFFRSNASASKNSSVRTFALPLVRNLRKPKSVFNNPNAPST